MGDNGDKLDDETKKSIETAIKEAKEVKDGDDLDAINKKKEVLSEASMKIGQAMYTSQSKEGEGGDGDGKNEEEKKNDDGTTQDAEFTEKKKDDDGDGGADDTTKKDDKK